ncbi:MAG: hypothetical protein ACI392_05560 [Paludibacteraceae bacterium]
MKVKYGIIIATIAGIILLTACNRPKRSADIANIDLNISIGRFDSALWTMNRHDLATAVVQLDSLYPDITPVYLEHVVEFGAVGDTITTHNLQKFFADTAVAQLYTETLTRFADLTDYETTLTDAFKRAKYFFPEKPTPRLYTHLSGLNQSMIVGDGFVSGSIDNYMGCDYPLYDRVGIYKYLRQNMRPEKLVPDYIVAWLSTEFPFTQHSGELFEEMIYRGKILYTASVLLPDLPDSLLIGYSAEQWDWCMKYEHDMWMVLIGSKHLFSRDAMIRIKYMNDAPFTKPFTQQSPGRAGAFVGWRIVEQYMREHPEVSPKELLLRNADEIMRETPYNP